MNLRDEILKEHSKKQTMKIVRHIGSDKKRFGELMTLFFGNEYRVTQRSAWIVNYCAEQHPELIKPYLKRMIAFLKPEINDAVRRNIVRILQFIEIPEALLGVVADKCFGLLQSADEPVAVKVFSMSVLANICKKEPDLKKELKLIIEDQLPFGSTGFRSRAKKILKQLEK